MNIHLVKINTTLKRTIQLKTAMAYELRSCDPSRPIRVIQILISHVDTTG